MIDLFFLITGLSIIFITILTVIALLYFIFFLRAIKNIATQAKRAAGIITDDLSELSKSVKSEGFKLGSFIKFVVGLKPKQTRKKK